MYKSTKYRLIIVISLIWVITVITAVMDDVYWASRFGIEWGVILKHIILYMSPVILFWSTVYIWNDFYKKIFDADTIIPKTLRSKALTIITILWPIIVFIFLYNRDYLENMEFILYFLIFTSPVIVFWFIIIFTPNLLVDYISIIRNKRNKTNSITQINVDNVKINASEGDFNKSVKDDEKVQIPADSEKDISFKRWCVYHTIALLLSIFVSLINPREASYDSHFSNYGVIMSLYFFVLIIVLIIALVNRLSRKKPSGINLFITYYVILILMFLYVTSFYLLMIEHYGLQLFNNTDSYFIVSVMAVLIFYFFALLIIVLVRKANNKTNTPKY